MKTMKSLLTALLLSSLAPVHAADTFLVENGQPRAEIVIAEKPARMTKLAAKELQTYLERKLRCMGGKRCSHDRGKAIVGRKPLP